MLQASLQQDEHPFRQIKKKVLAPLLVMFVVFLGVSIYAVMQFRHYLYTHTAENIEQGVQLGLSHLIDDDIHKINGLLSILLADKNIQSAWMNRDRAALMGAAEPVYRIINESSAITHLYFHDVQGMNFLRIHKPERFGDAIERHTMQMARSTGQMSSGLELGVLGQFVLRVVRPWYIDNQLVGYVELGREIDQISQRISDVTGAEQIVLIDKTMIEQDEWENTYGKLWSWSTYNDLVTVSSTMDIKDHELESAVFLLSKKPEVIHLDYAERQFMVIPLPLSDVSDTVVGYLLILKDISEIGGYFSRLIKIILLGWILLGMVLVIIFYDYFGRLTHQLEDSYKELGREIDQHSRTEKALMSSRDRLRESNKALESFSYSVSHDLRAPLRAIDGFSQALLEDYTDVLDQTGNDFLQRIRNASQRMSLLIDDLIKLSRIGRVDLDLDKADLTALAHETVAHLRELDPERVIDIDIQPGLSAYADRRLMGIVLNNLIGNAWKYTAKVEAPSIAFGRQDRDGQYVYFVRDNGVGFDMQFADKLFGAFQRLHGGEYEGTGIGLATVARIIHRHAGSVWAEAEPGQGATFYFTLPGS